MGTRANAHRHTIPQMGDEKYSAATQPYLTSIEHKRGQVRLASESCCVHGMCAAVTGTRYVVEGKYVVAIAVGTPHILLNLDLVSTPPAGSRFMAWWLMQVPL